MCTKGEGLAHWGSTTLRLGLMATSGRKWDWWISGSYLNLFVLGSGLLAMLREHSCLESVKMFLQMELAEEWASLLVHETIRQRKLPWVYAGKAKQSFAMMCLCTFSSVLMARTPATEMLLIDQVSLSFSRTLTWFSYKEISTLPAVFHWCLQNLSVSYHRIHSWTKLLSGWMDYSLVWCDCVYDREWASLQSRVNPSWWDTG